MVDKTSAFYALIDGRVQGVGFRYFVLRTSETLGLVGWVRNKYGGQVEVFAEGDREKLSQFIKTLHQGPPSAVVTKVQFEWKQATGKYKSFSVRLTG